MAAKRQPSAEVILFTDGACSGNPGPGGWAYILRHPESGRESAASGSDPDTTNNRMEMLAAVIALQALKEPCSVILTTDSQYVRQGITQWIHNWKKRDWKTADKKPVKNADLWQRLDKETARHSVDWRWVKGHAGHRENEMCDDLARNAAENPTQEDTGYQPS